MKYIIYYRSYKTYNVFRDLNDTTTIRVVRSDLEKATNKIGAKDNAELFFKLLDFYERNYNVPNIEVYSREINEKIFDPANEIIYKQLKRLVKEIIREDEDGR